MTFAHVYNEIQTLTALPLLSTNPGDATEKTGVGSDWMRTFDAWNTVNTAAIARNNDILFEVIADD